VSLVEVSGFTYVVLAALAAFSAYPFLRIVPADPAPCAECFHLMLPPEDLYALIIFNAVPTVGTSS
jgi:hypothetical protein